MFITKVGLHAHANTHKRKILYVSEIKFLDADGASIIFCLLIYVHICPHYMLCNFFGVYYHPLVLSWHWINIDVVMLLLNKTSLMIARILSQLKLWLLVQEVFYCNWVIIHHHSKYHHMKTASIIIFTYIYPVFSPPCLMKTDCDS